jgi:hypothetical protein
MRWLALLAFLPAVAYANAGTPLMWATILHLVFGNALIGVGEGLLLARLFRVPRGRSVLWLIAANYVSAWLGGVVLLQAVVGRVNLTIENIQPWFWGFVVVAFLITLVIEYPFFWLALRAAPRAMRRAVKATVMVNIASYAVLFGWYWMASRVGMMTQLTVVPVAEMHAPEGYSLYYLSKTGTEVIQARLDGALARTLKTVVAVDINDRLFARENVRMSYDLWIHFDPDDRKKARDELVVADFSMRAPIDGRQASDPAAEVYGTWSTFGEVPKITDEGDWRYRTGFWGVEGIVGSSERLNARFRYALETPFASWRVRNGTHLDGDYVVFQLGEDQVCILQPQTRKIALVARGHGPLVAKAKPVVAPAEAAVP